MSSGVTSGPARVIASGQVTAFAGHPIEIHLDVEGARLRVRFAFLRDAKGETVEVRTRPLDDGLCIEMYNVVDSSGRGSSIPVLLGEVGDFLLFLHFRTFLYGRTEDHTLHYTFFRASKEEVSWMPGRRED